MLRSLVGSLNLAASAYLLLTAAAAAASGHGRRHGQHSGSGGTFIDDTSIARALHSLARRGLSKPSLKDSLISNAGDRQLSVLDSSELSTYSFAAQNVTWTTSPFNPTGIPLAVRSPYVSTWLWGGANDRGGDLSAQFPSFWNGNSLPWCGIVTVEGISYTWMGVSANCAPGGRKAVQLSLNWTATSTTFVMRTGAVDVTVQFLSPITPKDLVRQTLPYSYLHVSVAPNDGQSHAVKLYSDITGEWASNDWTRNITWGQYVVNNTLLTQYAQVVPELLYSEVQDSTLYGQVVWATDMANTTAQSGPSSTLRQAFNTAGRLGSVPDTQYRQISNNQPALGFAKDLGVVSGSRSATALFAIGHFRDPAVSYTASNATYPNRSLYFLSAYPSMQSSIGFFYSDYAQALLLSVQFDAQVQQSAGSVSADYAGLCAITARQVFSGVELTITKTDAGFDTSDVMMFVKEIATSNYINTVDVMAPAWPFFAYINPEMIRYMLRPVVEYSEKYFPHPWAPHDIGKAYPNATGPYQVDAPYYIEESANMLFMALAYTRYSGKTDFVVAHYPILKQWANYLVNSTVYPVLQASTDDFAGELANMTSLAVKGVVGLGCMGQIAATVGQAADATLYTSTAQRYSNEVIAQAMATTKDHLKLSYGSSDDTWSTLYNLLPDKVFGLNLFSDAFYAMQGAWYAKQAKTYGVPLDSRSVYAKTDFELWTAAIYANNATLRDIFIYGVKEFLAFGATGQAVPDLYNTVNASSTGFVNRPVVGGAYAILALNSLKSANATTVANNAVAGAAVVDSSVMISPSINSVASTASASGSLITAPVSRKTEPGSSPSSKIVVSSASISPISPVLTPVSAAGRRLKRWLVM